MERGFNLNNGPFVKGIAVSLDAIGVHRQKYYGGILVVNHVHKILYYIQMFLTTAFTAI